MIIERVEFDSDIVRLGDKVSVGDVSIKVQEISLEPTGQVALIGAQNRLILIGNTPYRLYCVPKEK